MNEEIRELLDRIQTWMIENDYECGPEGNEIYKEIDELLGEERCEDCDLRTKDLIQKGDHHGGTKVVCRDRNACHDRSP